MKGEEGKSQSEKVQLLYKLDSIDDDDDDD